MQYLLLLLLISVSCASSPWTVKDVSLEKREWRFCSEHIDGPGKGLLGFCYSSQECRKKWLRKEECRKILLMCKWGEIECMKKYKLFDKKIR